jgi:septum site-determining protein MinC
MLEVSFQLKGSVVTVVVLELRHYDETLTDQLKAKIDAAPQFFVNSPVLINLEKLDNPDAVPSLQPLLGSCRELGLLPLGFAGAPDSLHRIIADTGLALLPPPGERASKMATRSDGPTEAAMDVAPEVPPSPRAHKIITRPVRSGQQVYAEGGDLILLAQVSEGAEVLADGHIHVYGALRGRALAGVRGDTEARIFCQSLEAELVSVAGHFLLQDAFDPALLKQPAQIHMAGDSLSIVRL